MSDIVSLDSFARTIVHLEAQDAHQRAEIAELGEGLTLHVSKLAESRAEVAQLRADLLDVRAERDRLLARVQLDTERYPRSGDTWPWVDRHGWVVPLPEGRAVRCGGPGICPDCQAEQREHERRRQAGADVPPASSTRPIDRPWQVTGQLERWLRGVLREELERSAERRQQALAAIFDRLSAEAEEPDQMEAAMGVVGQPSGNPGELRLDVERAEGDGMVARGDG